eukprot:TRINITY_DN4616_c0_g1_i1.p1 TRINITY_DN4616_c0_g1~~TRINITY_DN4616_c0_g1_i1.p1  ORF type:complete len:479 (+),score=32.40 TRINITY_DN4616_c0_g1_i1:84-1520(+)
MELKKNITLWTAMSYVVGTIIGSGIYSSPGNVLDGVGSGGAAILLWAAAGAVAMAGALCYVELGLRFSGEGGEMTYLKEIYNDQVGFMFTWVNSVVTRPASLALVCTIFGEHLHAAVGGPDILQKVFSLAGLTILASINGFSSSSSSGMQRALTFVKVLTLIGLMLLAAFPQYDPQDDLAEISLSNTSGYIGDWGAAFLNGLWAYDGWNGLAYATAEMNDPSEIRNAILIGVPLCTILYIMVNIAYMKVLSGSVIEESDSIAIDYLTVVLGSDSAGRVVGSLVVAISTFGAGNGIIFGASRLVFSASRGGFLPPCLGGLSPRQTPLRSILCQASMAAILISFFDFSALVVYFGMPTYLFYLLNIFGVILLRYRDTPPPPYQVPLPLPVLFSIFASVLVVSPAFSMPIPTVAAGSVVLLGLPVYYLMRSTSGRCLGSWWAAQLVPSEREINLTEMINLESSDGEDELTLATTAGDDMQA